MFDEMHTGSGGSNERYSWIRVKFLIHSYAEELQHDYPQLTFTSVFVIDSDQRSALCIHANMRMVMYCVHIWSKITKENCSDYAGVLYNLSSYTTRFYEACGLEILESKTVVL